MVFKAYSQNPIPDPIQMQSTRKWASLAVSI
jgi:hypothetical protein